MAKPGKRERNDPLSPGRAPQHSSPNPYTGLENVSLRLQRPLVAAPSVGPLEKLDGVSEAAFPGVRFRVAPLLPLKRGCGPHGHFHCHRCHDGHDAR